jgi:hypothetical protein
MLVSLLGLEDGLGLTGMDGPIEDDDGIAEGAPLRDGACE